MFDFNGFKYEPEIEEEESSVFLSIGDLMSGLLMIFALLFVTVLVQLKEREQPRRVLIGTVVGAMKANNIKVEVNPETGDVTIQDKILFDQDSAELKPAGKIFLNQFIPEYSRVIFSNEGFEKEITRVVIEGYTSSTGDYDSNLELSLLRSLSVSKFIFSNELDFPTKSDLRQKIIAAGRGEIDADQQKDDPKDRKVIFRFQFRGEDSLQLFQENQSLIPTPEIPGVIPQTKFPLRLQNSEGIYTLTVPEMNTTKSAYGGQLVVYDVHIAKMFEVTYSDCKQNPNGGSRTWFYRAGNGTIDMGKFIISCQVARDIANSYGLGKPETTTIEYSQKIGPPISKNTSIPILDITDNKVQGWMNFVQGFRPQSSSQ